MFRKAIKLPPIYIDVSEFRPFIISGSYRNDAGLPASNGHNLILVGHLIYIYSKLFDLLQSCTATTTTTTTDSSDI